MTVFHLFTCFDLFALLRNQSAPVFVTKLLVFSKKNLTGKYVHRSID